MLKDFSHLLAPVSLMHLVMSPSKLSFLTPDLIASFSMMVSFCGSPAALTNPDFSKKQLTKHCRTFQLKSKQTKGMGFETYLCFFIANREISELQLLGDFSINAGFLDASSDCLLSFRLRFFDLLGKISGQSLKIICI